MVRTADISLKVGGKSTRKGGTNGNVQSDSSPGTGGLNPIRNWPTPTWQKPITEFFKNHPVEKEKKTVPRVDVIESIPGSSKSIEETTFNHGEKENVEPPSSNSLMDVEMSEEARTNKRTAEEEPMFRLAKWPRVTDEIAMYIEEAESYIQSQN